VHLQPVFAFRDKMANSSETLEGFIAKDIEAFWMWCPAPLDGLHRTALLVKLFDYCGLTRKEDKLWYKVRGLDQQLFRAGVSESEQIEPNRRISIERMRSDSFITTIAKHANIRQAWESKRAGKIFVKPLAYWVELIIAQEKEPEARTAPEVKK